MTRDTEQAERPGGRETVVGVLHPGEMGAAIGSVLRDRGCTVLWASTRRGAATRKRAAAAGLSEVETVEELSGRSDVILSICPPHAALDVARSVTPSEGVSVDANAVAPATAHQSAKIIEAGRGRFVDGGLVGTPPDPTNATRLYLSGDDAQLAAELFAGTPVEARVVGSEIGAASALKMTYAAWTKGTAAVLLAIRALARAEGVEQALVDEWRASLPELPDRSARAARSAAAKGWRWIAEMEEIASTFAAAGLPDGFHRAAAEVFRRSARLERDIVGEPLDDVLNALTTPLGS